MARGRKPSTPKEPEKKIENWTPEGFADLVYIANKQAGEIIRRNLTQDPSMANLAMKGINNSPVSEYTPEQIVKMMRSPWQYERELKNISRHLENAVMPYNRIVDSFTKVLLYNYEMRPITKPPKDATKFQTYLNGKEKCYDVLKKLNVRDQFSNITKSVVIDGAKFVYVRQNGEYIDLQEMPFEFCKITGRTSLGYTYSFDMSFFDQWGDLSKYAPEFAKWYSDLLRIRKNNPHYSMWYDMPFDKGFVFKFDETNASVQPPLAGVFGDAMEIYEYKNILKARAVLDAFALVYQQIPLDDKGKPKMTSTDATRIAAAIEQALPAGVHTTTSPFEGTLMTFSRPSGEKNIIPDGEEKFYRSAGVAYEQYGGDNKGVMAQKYSALLDYSYVRHLYFQYSRFVNYLLSQASKQYKFRVVFDGNLYTNTEDIKTYSADVAKGAPVGRLYAMYGYEPWETENCLLDEHISGIKSLMVPPQSAYQPTSSTNPTGRPSKPDEELQSPSSEAMRNSSDTFEKSIDGTESGAFSL